MPLLILYTTKNAQNVQRMITYHVRKLCLRNVWFVATRHGNVCLVRKTSQGIQPAWGKSLHGCIFIILPSCLLFFSFFAFWLFGLKVPELLHYVVLVHIKRAKEKKKPHQGFPFPTWHKGPVFPFPQTSDRNSQKS